MSDDVQVGDYIGNVACEDCGSKDNLSIYTKIEQDESTYIDGYCWGTCHFDGSGYKNKSKIEEMGYTSEESIAAKITKPKLTPEQIEYILDQIKSMPINGLKTRRLKRVTMERYGVHSEMNGQVTQSLYFPSSVDGDIVGFKLKDLSGARKEPYAARGSVKKTNELFGQRLFNKGGKFLIITEGECFKPDAEILTATGWVRFDKYQGQQVLQYNDDGTSDFVTPTAVVQKQFSGELVNHSVRGYSSVTTPGHNMVSLNNRGEIIKHTADNVPNRGNRIPRVSILNGEGIDLTYDQIALTIAVCADSKIDKRKTKNDYASFGFKKQRKIDRLERILNSLNIEFSKNSNNGYTYFGFTLPDFIVDKKLPVQWIGSATLTQRNFILDEIVEWDGNKVNERNQTEFSSAYYDECKWVQTMAHTSGRCSTIMSRTNEYGSWFKVSILHGKSTSSWQSMTSATEEYSGNVHCVTVPSGMIMVRINGFISISGNCDAMAFYQALSERSNGKYETACVSINNGSGSVEAQIKANYEWITSFEKVLIAFDNDDPGKIATEIALKLLKPSQSYRVNFTRYKDANEYVIHGQEAKLVDDFWKAEKFSPVGIIGSSQTFNALVERAKFVKIALPDFAEDLQLMMNGGIALGEITTIAAASSVGKTTMVNEFLYHFIMTSPYKVGIISLESDVGELTENLMSLHISKKLANMPDDEKLKLFHSNGFDSAYKDLTHTEEGNDRYYILDHQGAVVDGELMKNIEFLVKSMDCKVIILDPLTLALSGKQNDGMDVFMSDLLRFVKREKVAHVNVVHVRKNQSGSKANSTGAEIHEEDIKGSGSIFQVSMNNILLMRDKENVDPLIRNTTKAMMSKNRRCGNTGPAGFWFYNSETSRMEKGRDPQTSYEDSLNEFEELGAFEESNLDLVGQDVDNQEESKDNEGYVFKSPD